MKKTLLMLVVLGVLGGAQIGFAQISTEDCLITGTITAEPSTDPSLPNWTYTMVMVWDTGSPYALSHADLLLDTATGTCVCQDFEDALIWPSIIGSSDGEGGCTVDYGGFLECDGDPSIPGVDNILLKFEPLEDGCEPGATGTATYVFYSNLPPAPIDEDILSLVDKFALNYCFGNLSGDFPSMACDPVGLESSTWGQIKGQYR